jgi:hypothetical protein
LVPRGRVAPARGGFAGEAAGQGEEFRGIVGAFDGGEREAESGAQYESAYPASAHTRVILRWSSRSCCSSGPVLDARGGDQHHQQQLRTVRDLRFAAPAFFPSSRPTPSAPTVPAAHRDRESMIAAAGGRSKLTLLSKSQFRII